MLSGRERPDIFWKISLRKCISETIIRALEDPDREHIAVNARTMVKKEFSFESTVRQWKRVLEEI